MRSLLDMMIRFGAGERRSDLVQGSMLEFVLHDLLPESKILYL